MQLSAVGGNPLRHPGEAEPITGVLVRSGRQPGAVVIDLDHGLLRAVHQRNPYAGRVTSVPENVGQSLLHRPVHDQLDAGPEPAGRAGHFRLYIEAGSADLLEQRAEVGEAGLRTQGRAVAFGAQHPEQSAHVLQRLPAGRRDLGHRRVRPAGIDGQFRCRRVGQPHHDRQAMGDDVMHVAGDPGPFGGKIEQRLLVAFAFLTLAALGRGGQGRAPVAHGGHLRPATTTAAVASASAVTALAFGSVLVVMATIQGALTPFSSLISLLPIGHGDPALTGSSDQIQHYLAGHQALPRTPAPLGAIIADFQRYHAVLAVQATTLAVALIGLTVLTWRRAPTAGRPLPRAKPLLRLLATAFALLTVIVLVVDSANFSTALNPDPALRLVFSG